MNDGSSAGPAHGATRDPASIAVEKRCEPDHTMRLTHNAKFCAIASERNSKMARNLFALTGALLAIASSIQSSHAQTVTVPPGGRVIAPEYQQMAIKRAEERKKLESCNK